jgi:hypothetical protein
VPPLKQSDGCWRHLRPNEVDHELLWLAVSVTGGVGAWTWLKLGLPLPQCVFHMLTGHPCPACGATRCVRFLFAGNFGAALRINPLVFFGFGAMVFYDLYAATVLALRLPRFRPSRPPPGVGRAIRFAVIAMIAINWTWLVWSGV